MQHLGTVELQEMMKSIPNVLVQNVHGTDGKLSIECPTVSEMEEASDIIRLAEFSSGSKHTELNVQKPQSPASKQKPPVSPKPPEFVQIKAEWEEYEALKVFGRDKPWFKHVANQLEWKNSNVILRGSATKFDTDIKAQILMVKSMRREEICFESFEMDKFDFVLSQLDKEFSDIIALIPWKKKSKFIAVTESYEAVVKLKHRADVLLGRVKVSEGRRNRRFNSGAAPVGESHASQEMTTPQSPAVLSSGDTFTFKTTEGITVKVYAGSIVKLSVDCIVNAANENLSHGGGVAYAISRAAGYDFDKESKEYVKRHGKIPVGQCCVTSAGDLYYKCVIHTVGPRWNDYPDKTQCGRDLQEAVEVTFREAVSQGCSSIAIPAISSGKVN